MPTRRHGEDFSRFVNVSRNVTLLPSDRASVASPKGKARQGWSQVVAATDRPSIGSRRASLSFGERESRVSYFPFWVAPALEPSKPIPHQASGSGGPGWLFPVDSLSESNG